MDPLRSQVIQVASILAGLALVFALDAQQTPRLEQPAGVVLQAAGEKLHEPKLYTPQQASGLAVYPGMLLFSGDRLENENGSVEFVLCGDRKKRRLKSSGKTVIEGAIATGDVEEGDAAPACRLPAVVRWPVASENQYESLKASGGQTYGDRLMALSAEKRRDFLQDIDPIERALQRNSADLAARISRATVLQQYGLNVDARDEFLSIQEDWPQAIWARESAKLANAAAAAEPTDVTKGAGTTYALLIGISEYKNNGKGIDNLAFAADDARHFAAFLNQPRAGGPLEKQQLRVLTNKEATPDTIRNAIDELFDRAGKNDTILLFIAAHGVVASTKQDPKTGKKSDPQGFILTYDSEIEDAPTSAVPMTDLRQLMFSRLAKVKRVLVYVDVCRAARIGSITDTNSINDLVHTLLETNPGKLGAMLASGPHEPAYEAPEYGGGYGAFTYFLLRGLNGEADQAPAGNGDGIVTSDELVSYVKQNVRLATWDNQHPRDLVLLSATEPMALLEKPGIELGGWTKPPKGRFRGSKYFISSAGLAPRGPAEVAEEETSASEKDELVFDKALAAGALLDGPESASAALERMRQNPRVLRERVSVLERRLRVALENSGQGVIVTYLRGEEAQPKESDFVAGARYFERALELAPRAQFDESRARFCRGRAYIFQKRYEEAIPLLERSIRLDPTRAYAYNALGIAYLEQVPRDAKYYDYALRALTDAISRAPYWAYPLHNLALAYSEKGDFDRAIRIYQEAMKLTPYYSYLPHSLGMIYQQLNRTREAEASYRLAVERAGKGCQSRGETRCPQRALAYNALGTLYDSKGRTAKATHFYNLARSDQDSLSIRHNLAALLAEKRHRFAEAETLWRSNLNEDPQHLPSLMGLAEALAKQKRLADAIAMYRRVIELRPDYVPARISLASMLVETHQAAEALVSIEESLALKPDSAELWILKGDTLVQQGRATEARSAYDTARGYARDWRERKRIERAIRRVR